MRRQAIIVNDLTFGDAGKGSIVDYLTREHQAHTVVRYNGGSQAAHNVVTPDGRHHTFAQFGSGMLVSDTKTHLSRFMLVDPYSMSKEEEFLERQGVANALARTTIDEQALIITPYQKAMNRIREMARGDERHGSCGMGIGETMADSLANPDNALRAGDLANEHNCLLKLEFIRRKKQDEFQAMMGSLPLSARLSREGELFGDSGVSRQCLRFYKQFTSRVSIVGTEYLATVLNQPGTVVFEGAQGVLIDEWYGFHPYTTWSTTTPANADTLLTEQQYSGKVTKLGVIRAYATRHGTGPFVTEDQDLTAALPDQHNATNPWQLNFRVGWFDLVATRYAMQVAGKLDYLAVTNLDRFSQIPEWQLCFSYQYEGIRPQMDLKQFCRLNGEAIDRLWKKPQKEDLAHQEHLTQVLEHCTPLYGPLIGGEKGINDYVRLLETELKTPVAITSFGPTAIDKQQHLTW